MDVKVTYIRSNGQVRAVSVPVGSSVMHAAVSNGVPEILGDCSTPVWHRESPIAG